MLATDLPPTTSGNQLCPEFVSERPLPANFQDGDRELFEHELRVVISGGELVTLSNINVSPHGLLFRNGRVRQETFAYPREAERWRNIRKRAKLLVAGSIHAPRNTIDEEVYWVTDSKSAEFFHWMGDALPRIFTIKDQLANATLLLPESYKGRDYIRKTLKAFEIGEVRYVERMTRCRRLFVPTGIGPSGNFNEPLLQQLRDHLLGHFGPRVPVPAGFEEGRLYVSRTRAPKRRIVNEEDILPVLARHGFRTVHFEEFPFEQQLAIAMNTRFLVSNHGAGLSNMLFMAARGRVLELRKQGDTHNNCYFAMSAALQHEYFYQVCPAMNPDEGAYSADLIVDPDELEANIRLVLGSAL